MTAAMIREVCKFINLLIVLHCSPLQVKYQTKSEPSINIVAPPLITGSRSSKYRAKPIGAGAARNLSAQLGRAGNNCDTTYTWLIDSCCLSSNDREID